MSAEAAVLNKVLIIKGAKEIEKKRILQGDKGREVT